MQPNIIFIMADQLAARYLGTYGSGVDSTPNLDRLAARGIRFDRCYATCPVCAPNRASLLTGRSPVVHGLTTNNYTAPPETPTHPQLLRDKGYRTGGFGKFHQHPMPLPVIREAAFLGFDESVVHEDRKWGPWLDWVEKNHPEHFDAALALCWSENGDPARQEQLGRKRQAWKEIIAPRIEDSGWKKMWTSPLPPEVHDTTFLIDTGIDFMQRHLKSQTAQPFFCNISLVDPHDPYDPPAPYADMYDPNDIPEALPAEWKESGPDCLGPRQETLGFDSIADDRDKVQKLRAMYHGSLRYMDDQIGRVIEFVEENGLWENTIILFSTDHGDMMGDQGLMAKGMPHYDSGIRVPLIAACGGIQPGVSDRLTCTLDFFPTFCDLAEISAEKRPPLEGKSFIAHLYPDREPAPDPYGHHPATPEWDRMLYNEPEWREISVAFGAESVITDDGWRLTRFVQGGGQMFDLNTDPDEQNNLYNNPDYADKRQELLERLINITTRPHRMPQYRNMPVIDGVPHRLGGRGNSQLIPISADLSVETKRF